MSEGRTFEKGIFSGLAISIAGSLILPVFQLVAVVAGTILAAVIAAKNYREGLITGFVTGFSIVFVALLNLYTGAGLPVQGIMSSAMSFSPANTTMGLFISASLLVMALSTVSGAITGYVIHEEEFDYSTA